VSFAGVPDIPTAPPPEFDCPGGIWSPETLLIASIVDCFILTFRGVSRAVHLEWNKLEAQAEGTLERAAGNR
jgi:organic hydroperoxide reductase OsmC/OhrA